jgi:hypothetical protein
MYFDMFYIQWHHLTKKDLWNKAYMNERINNTKIENLCISRTSSDFVLKNSSGKITKEDIKYYIMKKMANITLYITLHSLDTKSVKRTIECGICPINTKHLCTAQLKFSYKKNQENIWVTRKAI